MAEPHIKAITDPATGKAQIEVDQAGYDMFMRLINRAEPLKKDSPENFKKIKERVSGAFVAVAAGMGWDHKSLSKRGD